MENAPLKILLIESDPEFAWLIEGMLKEAKGATFDLVSFAHFEEGLTCLMEGVFDLALIDLSLPDGAGLANIERAQAEAVRVPIIVLGHVDDEAVAIEAVHVGAQDYLLKSQLNPQLLGRAIRYAIERQRADAALLEAEEKYRGIFEHIVEGIFQTTPDGHYISANAALARIYGYGSPAELMASVKDIGRKLYVEPGRRAEFIKLMQEHDTVTDFESRIYRKDGSIIWIAENVRAIRDAWKQLLYYEGTVEDITQRKRAEENLRQSEALYHSLVETLPQNIFRKDKEGHFTFVNQLFCAALKKPASEIIGRTDFDLFPRELAEKYQKDDLAVMEQNKNFETVEEHQPPEGEKIYVQVVKTPLHDAHGKIIGLQGIFWDISERRRAEEQVRLASAELARSREALRKKNAEMEDDLKMAREIQQTMLPQQFPTFPKSAEPRDSRFRFSYRYLPTGTVGGDYFNVLSLSDTEAGVFICDVMGHGVRSALVAAMVRALVEEIKSVSGDPGKLLAQLNRDLCAILKQTGSPTLITAFYLTADSITGRLRYANAGHPKPFVIHRNSGKLELLANRTAKSNPALGLFSDAQYPTSESQLAPGDLVMLFTDGLYEVENADGQLYTHEMLVEAVSKRTQMPAAELFDSLLAEIRAFAQNADFVDDVCLVGMEVAEVK
ncbi:MAG TPA: SpoIIE family protein phosphatase [Verrucomicrobiae bacterium]|jgi:sigma-B regulation protein RsbU (phosphoserine phosphatase)|nr:SpoIIE family protein phosphatase [Verrucomicrobiae bacterium]